MPELPVGNITFSLSGHQFVMSAPDLKVSLHPSQLHRAAKEEGAKEERAACAELVRAAGCGCDPLHWPHNINPPEHAPDCPQALAKAIEGRGAEA